MYQQQPYYAQMRQPQNQVMIKGRPVSSIEEARAAPIDFDGSVFYFPDLANKRIYTKQINMDGTASLNMYELTEIPTVQDSTSQDFITREELEQILLQFKNDLQPKQNVQQLF